MAGAHLQASGLTRVFNRKTVFTHLNFQLEDTHSLTVKGKNGSGKTTLLRILAGVLSPTQGSTELTVDSRAVSPDDRFRYVGFVAPYLQLYDEFSSIENLRFFGKVRGLSHSDEMLMSHLSQMGLANRAHDPLRTLSSGLKQRAKYAFALLHDPLVLLLDEPTTNLDSGGVDMVHRIIQERQQRGIVVIGTNQQDEVGLCSSVLDLDRPQEPE